MSQSQNKECWSVRTPRIVVYGPLLDKKEIYLTSLYEQIYTDDLLTFTALLRERRVGGEQFLKCHFWYSLSAAVIQLDIYRKAERDDLARFKILSTE